MASAMQCEPKQTMNIETKNVWVQNEVLKARIIDMSKDAFKDPVGLPDLDGCQKRWLVAGIALHKVMSPVLRKYVETEVQKQYTICRTSHNIHVQTYPNYLPKYSKHDLNYEVINNNRSVPKIRRKPDLAKYDFHVVSAVDFSKLFLQTHMAHYTAFDDKCDQSALLGIISNMATFPTNISTVADKIRADVRNPWAHCNFPEWDVIKFQLCFQLFHQLVRNMRLPKQEEQGALALLTNWETNGLHLINGTTIGLDLLREIQRETQGLAEFCITFTDINEENLGKIKDALTRITTTFEEHEQAIQCLQDHQKELETKSDSLAEDVRILYDRTEHVKVRTHHITDRVERVEDDLKGTKSSLLKQ